MQPAIAISESRLATVTAPTARADGSAMSGGAIRPMACARLAATPATLVMRPPRRSAVPRRPRDAGVRRNCRGGVSSGGGAQFADMQAAPSAGAKLCAPAACRGRSLSRPLGASSVTTGRNWFGRGRSAFERFGKDLEPPLAAVAGSQGACMRRSEGQLSAKALRAPADSCVLKIDPLSGAGGKGMVTGTDSRRGVRQGLPVMVRSLRSSQNFRWPRAWK